MQDCETIVFTYIMRCIMIGTLLCINNAPSAGRHRAIQCMDMTQVGRKSRERVEHTLGPLFDGRSKTLVLGTMPSPKSREVSMYYGNPRNRFWPVLAAVLGEPVPTTNEERRALALAHGVALWDVLQSCTIVGASDASIEDPEPTDLPWLLSQAPITRMFTTGATAARLYARFQLPRTGIEAVALPSTSPANASWSLERLVSAYRVLAE